MEHSHPLPEQNCSKRPEVLSIYEGISHKGAVNKIPRTAMILRTTIGYVNASVHVTRTETCIHVFDALSNSPGPYQLEHDRQKQFKLAPIMLPLHLTGSHTFHGNTLESHSQPNSSIIVYGDISDKFSDSHRPRNFHENLLVRQVMITGRRIPRNIPGGPGSECVGLWSGV